MGQALFEAQRTGLEVEEATPVSIPMEGGLKSQHTSITPSPPKSPTLSNTVLPFPQLGP